MVTLAIEDALSMLAPKAPRVTRLCSRMLNLLENDHYLHELLMTAWVKVVTGSKADVENFVWETMMMDKGQDSKKYWSTVKAGYKALASDTADDDADDDADFFPDTITVVDGRETQKLVKSRFKDTHTSNGMKKKKNIKDLLRVYLKCHKHTQFDQKHRYFHSLAKALIGLVIFARRQNDDHHRYMIIHQSVITVSAIVDNATNEINNDTQNELKKEVAELEKTTHKLVEAMKNSKKEHEKQMKESAKDLKNCEKEKTELAFKLNIIRTILNSNVKEDDSERLARIRKKIEEETEYDSSGRPLKRMRL